MGAQKFLRIVAAEMKNVSQTSALAGKNSQF
jgi:hypothetical protein